MFIIVFLHEQGFFEELQNRESEFGISDIQLGLATLEEVFLNIARRAELESATAEGTLVTLDLASGLSLEVNSKLQNVKCIILFKCRVEKIKVMYRYQWEQDLLGSLTQKTQRIQVE